MDKLIINKTLESNLPDIVQGNEIHFTETGKMYINKNDNSLMKIGISEDEMNDQINQLNEKIESMPGKTIINEISNPLTTSPLEYGVFKISADTSGLTSGNIFPFDQIIEGNMQIPTNGIIKLKNGVTYSIELGLYATSSTSNDVRLECYNITTGNVLFTGAKSPSTNGSNILSSDLKCIITPTNDIEMGIRANQDLTKIHSTHTYLIIQEIRNNPVNQYGGFQTEILFDGNAIGLENKFTLTNSINNYDLLIVTHAPEITASKTGLSHQLIYVKDINIGEKHNIYIQGYDARRTAIYFTSENEFSISSIDDTTYYPKVYKMIGIKGQLPSLLVGGEF